MTSITQKNTLSALKSRSLKPCGQQLQDSFMNQQSFQHTQTVKKALIRFITSSLGQNQLKFFGNFDHNFQITKISQESHGSESFTKMIKKNQLLSDIQKEQFLLDLEKQIQLKKLMEQLNSIQNQKTVSQLCYITLTIWERYLEFQRAFIVHNPIVPKFQCSKDLLQQHFGEQPQLQIQKISLQTLLNAAEDAANELYLVFLNDPKIMNLSLRKIDLNIPKIQMHTLFRDFLRVFVKAIYLSIEGYFKHPDSEQGDFDQYLQYETGWSNSFLEMEIQSDDQLPHIFF